MAPTVAVLGARVVHMHLLLCSAVALETCAASAAWLASGLRFSWGCQATAVS